MNKNNVDFELSDADLTQIKDNLSEISLKLPFLIGLITGEKRKKFKLGDKSWAFITEAHTNANLIPQLYPQFMNLADFSSDYKLLIKMSQIQQMINVLARNVNDTVFELEAECLDSALEFYSNIQKAAKRNSPEAAVINDRLKKYFERKPRAKKNLKKNVKLR